MIQPRRKTSSEWMVMLLLVFVGLIMKNGMAANHHVLLDVSGNWNLPRMPDRTISEGLVAIITSPGTPSTILDSSDAAALLTLQEQQQQQQQGDDDKTSVWLSCRGSSLCSTSLPERTSLATTSLVASVLVLEGITAGDLEGGLRHSRHARTLTALFRARLLSNQQPTQQQALILSLPSIVSDAPPPETDEKTGGEDEEREDKASSKAAAALLDSVRDEVKAIFEAVAAETDDSRVSLDTLYQLHLLEGSTQEKIWSLAREHASALAAPMDSPTVAEVDANAPDADADADDTPTATDADAAVASPPPSVPPTALSPTLVSLLSQAYQQVRQSPGLLVAALDPPYMAQSYLNIRQSYSQHAKNIRATTATWKSRVARGGWVPGFGPQAEQLRTKTLQRYMQETREALGWSGGADAGTSASTTVTAVGEATSLTTLPRYRFEVQQQLANLVDSAIREVYQDQVTNLEKNTLKQLQDQLMKITSSSTSTPPPTSPTTSESKTFDQGAALRAAAFSFDTIMDSLEVPSLGLTKAKASRAINVKLHDTVEAFPNSPRMQLKRMAQVQKTTNKQRKPQERSIDLGLDLVAMLRPDGFGSFQGFCGYQLGGTSITVGVHNDADDPQVIAQFGGVRPPLLRVQPKLRLDVEL